MGTRVAGRMVASLLALTVGGMSAPVLAGGSIKDDPYEEPKREWELSGNVAVTSDYIFRGYSQSKSRPAVQGGVDLGYKWFYAGAWGSLIDFGKDGNFPTLDVAHTEIDLYAGIKPVLGPVTLDIGVIYYMYPNARDGAGYSNAELDYVELKFGASGDLWKDASAGITLFYSPEYTGKSGEVFTVEGAFSQGLPSIGNVSPSISATLGYQSGDTLAYRTVFGNGSDNYMYWNVGLGLGFGDRFSLDFRYWDTDVKENNAAAGFSDGFCSAKLFSCDEAFVGTAKVTF